MALSPYTKPALSVGDQVQRLKNKGMLIYDLGTAKNLLERIGYYRLSAYWHPFKDHSQSSLSRRFQENTQFDDVIAFYQFDTKLRNNLLFGLGRIEVGLRAALVNFFASISANAYLDMQNYTLSSSNSLTPDLFDLFSRIEKNWNRARNADCVKNFQKKYEPYPPIWNIAETWDWGTLYNIIQHLNQSLGGRFVDLLQRHAGVSRHDYFLQHEILVSWLKSLNALRNYCAHQERIWNRDYTFRKPQEPRPSATLKTLYPNLQKIRLHHLIVVMCGFHRLFKIDDVWFDDFVALLKNDAPEHPLISYSRAGFASDWTRTEQQLEALKLWMNQ